jgi:FtsP/CotA-like multicopper oxidase with cupredoxin domain
LARSRKVVLGIVIVVLAAGVVLSVAYALYGRGGQSVTTGLPSYCKKPAGGYLIVASIKGYNDSVDHGVPAKPWPVVSVQKGSTVTITVCNVDHQAHGFQVTHYFDSKIQTVVPGQAITVSFVADETGTFQIYCSIFCTVHWAMQSGELVVS